MPTPTDNIITSFERADGQERVHIVQKPSGHFSFEGERQEEDLGYVFWAPFGGSGIYATAHEAKHAAFSEVPWLRDGHLKTF